MKQVLIVSVSEVTKIHPKLESKVRVVVFTNVDKGRKFVENNPQKIFHVQLADRED